MDLVDRPLCDEMLCDMRVVQTVVSTICWEFLYLLTLHQSMTFVPNMHKAAHVYIPQFITNAAMHNQLLGTQVS